MYHETQTVEEYSSSIIPAVQHVFGSSTVNSNLGLYTVCSFFVTTKPERKQLLRV